MLPLAKVVLGALPNPSLVKITPPPPLQTTHPREDNAHEDRRSVTDHVDPPPAPLQVCHQSLQNVSPSALLAPAQVLINSLPPPACRNKQTARTNLAAASSDQTGTADSQQRPLRFLVVDLRDLVVRWQALVPSTERVATRVFQQLQLMHRILLIFFFRARRWRGDVLYHVVLSMAVGTSSVGKELSPRNSVTSPAPTTR